MYCRFFVGNEDPGICECTQPEKEFEIKLIGYKGNSAFKISALKSFIYKNIVTKLIKNCFCCDKMRRKKLLSTGIFPLYSYTVALEIDLLETYLSLNLRAATALNAFTDSILGKLA